MRPPRHPLNLCSLSKQIEFFTDQCNLIGLGTKTPAEIVARKILTGGMKL